MGRISNNERVLIALVRDGQLEIDTGGRVWRVAMRHGLKQGGSHVVPVARRRAEHRTPQGYLQVRAMLDGKRVHTGAHRLVWQHLKGEIPPGEEINHRNGLKDDNRPDNLLCGSAGANSEHAHRGGLVDQFGQKNPAAKLTDNQIAQIRLAYSQGGYTQLQLAERFGVAHQHVSRIVKGIRRPKQGGPVGERDHRKKAAGRTLDGRVHDEFPVAQ